MGGFGTGINALNLSGTAFGLGQGLNVQSIVQSLTQAAQAGETQYLNEQTLYRTRPDVSIDGKRVVYSSTAGAAASSARIP